MFCKQVACCDVVCCRFQPPLTRCLSGLQREGFEFPVSHFFLFLFLNFSVSLFASSSIPLLLEPQLCLSFPVPLGQRVMRLSPREGTQAGQVQVTATLRTDVTRDSGPGRPGLNLPQFCAPYLMDLSFLVCKTHTDHHLLGLLWRLNEITSLRTGRAQCSVTHVLALWACLPCHHVWGLSPQEVTQRPRRIQVFLVECVPSCLGPSIPTRFLILFSHFSFLGVTSPAKLPTGPTNCWRTTAKVHPPTWGLGSMTKCGPGFNPKEPKRRPGIEIQACRASGRRCGLTQITVLGAGPGAFKSWPLHSMTLGKGVCPF